MLFGTGKNIWNGAFPSTDIVMFVSVYCGFVTIEQTSGADSEQIPGIKIIVEKLSRPNNVSASNMAVPLNTVRQLFYPDI